MYCSPGVSDSVGQGWGQGNCVSSTFPGEAAAAAAETAPGGPLCSIGGTQACQPIRTTWRAPANPDAQTAPLTSYIRVSSAIFKAPLMICAAQVEKFIKGCF